VDIPGVLGLIGTVHPVLQEMQGYAEARESKFLVESKIFEAEEIFIQVFGEITTYKLITAIVKSIDTIGSGVRSKSWTKQISKVRFHTVL
jgi:hypothetical protein